MKKIKVFLGAYINQTNAQNLNCLSLAKYLDKSKFELYALAINHGNLGRFSIAGVTTFNCKYPVKFTQWLGFFWGIQKSDVAYLPRGNNYRIQRSLVKLFNRKCFKTVENVIDQEALTTALSVLGTVPRAKENYSFTTKTFSITSFMRRYNHEQHGINSEDLILPPVIDTALFRKVSFVRKSIRRIVFLGNDMKRKRVNDFVALSELHPSIEFLIIGKDSGFLENILNSNSYNNLTYLGMLTHSGLLEKLKECDLHILTSKSEGFPKGIIECAAAGVPSLVFNDYGAEEWIQSWENGVVCETLEDMDLAIKKLKESPNLMSHCSKGAIELSEQYAVKKVVGLYEKVIQDLYAS